MNGEWKDVKRKAVMVYFTHMIQGTE